MDELQPPEELIPDDPLPPTSAASISPAPPPPQPPPPATEIPTTSSANPTISTAANPTTSLAPKRQRRPSVRLGEIGDQAYDHSHEGHLSLVREAHKHAHKIVVSIYVNPGQFSPNEDLFSYPSNFLRDIDKLKSVPGGVDAVFHPYDLYDYGSGGGGRNVETKAGGKEDKKLVSCLEEGGGAGHETWVRVEKLESGLCGKSKPVFFRGVATVVAKLFNVVEPDVVLFGKKDYQQWRIIERMVSFS